MSEQPYLALRVSSTYGETRRTHDLILNGDTGQLVAEGGESSTFAAADIWPVVRDLLPDLPLLRSNPAPTRPEHQKPPPSDLADLARAAVVIAVTVSDAAGELQPLSLRTWLTTDDTLFVYEQAANTCLGAAPGALAEHLLFDVAGALDLMAAAVTP